MSDNVIPIFDTQQAERQFRHESVADPAYNDSRGRNSFPVCKHCRKPLNEWRAGEVCRVLVANFNSAQSLENDLSAYDEKPPVVAAANLVSVLAWMRKHGSSVVLIYSGYNQSWECSWMRDGKSFTAYSPEVCDAVRECLRQARSCESVDAVQ